jgi:hypothetical protein
VTSDPAPVPPYGQQNPGYNAPPTNTLAILSLVLGLAGLFTFVTAIAGVITGHIAMGQIKRSNESGHGLALGGVISGWIAIGLWVMAFGALVLLAVLGVTLFNILS